MIWRLVPLVLLVGACDPAPPPRVAPPKAAFESQIQAMENARAVEAQMQEAAEAQRQQIEAATGQPAS